jgi:RimJ/RimL family protein N-acetyltransferase
MQILVTSRLTMRPPAMPDAEDIAAWLSEWDVARMLAPIPHPYRLEHAENWIKEVRSRSTDLVFTIHRERLIGVVSVGNHENGKGDGIPTLGYWLGSRWHGHGFMTEAAGRLLEHAFDRHGFSAIRSSVFHDNPASLAVQRKLGFVETGDDEIWSCSRQGMVARKNTVLTAEAFAAIRASSPRRNAA